MCNKNSTIFGKKTRSIFVKFTASILPLILFGLFSVSDASAYTASLTVPSTTNIDVAAVGNGASVTPSNVVVDSTCPLGYTVSISGPADSTLYKDGDNTESNTIPASSGTPANPVSILGNNLGTWGYTMASDATVSSNFIGLTDTVNQIFSKNAASASGGDTIPVNYGVSVPISLNPGNYTPSESSPGSEDDTIIYYLTPSSNCTNLTIKYNDNGANSSTTMGITHATIEDNEVSLVASNYQRSGYGFAGWSLVPLNADSATFQTDLSTAKTNNEVFGPNEDIITDSNFFSHAIAENNELVVYLYAIWVKPETGATLQNWNGCGSLSIGGVAALTDLRDNDTYAVARLADGNCWMIENLRLDYDADFTESLSQGFGKNTSYGNFVGLALPETTDFWDSTAANSIYYSGVQTGTATIDINSGDLNSGQRFPRYNNNNTNSDSTVNPNTTVANMTDTDQNIYSYGNYYTWAAAIASTEPVSSGLQIVSTSICPAGWRLPKSFGTKNYEAFNDYWALIVEGINGGIKPSNYNSESYPYYTGSTEGKNITKAITKYPNNIVYPGTMVRDHISNRGTLANYWGANAIHDTNSFFASYNKTASNPRVFPGTQWGTRSTGYSIRCVINPTYTVSFNANGGSGSMGSQNITVNHATRLSYNTFVAPTIGSSYQDANGTTILGTNGKAWSFWGWNTEVDGTGDWYKDGEPVTDIASPNGTITLYAQWKQATLSDMNTPTTGTKQITHDRMQDMTGEVCYNSEKTTSANAPATSLIDDRDGVEKSYNISKLEDGNCWMTTNLALGTNRAIILTSDDTDIKAGMIRVLPAGNTTASSSYGEFNIRLTNESGNNSNGVFYNWPAAVFDVGSTDEPIASSICPRNWNLPTSDQYSDLATASAYSSTNLTTDPPSSFIDNGGFTNGSTFYNTGYGFYWTSSSDSLAVAYGVRVENSGFTITASSTTTYGDYKSYRKNIRCIAGQGHITINYVANNNTGLTSAKYFDIANDQLASETLFPVANHKSFKEWNTNPNGTGTSYNPGDFLSPNDFYPGQELTLYAIWEDVYTVSFINTDSGETFAKKTPIGQDIMLAPYATWSVTNYELKGWDTNSAGSNAVYTKNEVITPSGDMTLYTVWTPLYRIVYDINTDDSNATGTTGGHSNVSAAKKLTLNPSNYSRVGYGFAGWSFDSSAQPGGNSPIYGPAETITPPDASVYNEQKTIYAVWVQSAGNLQGWNGCTNLSIGDVTALTDLRDNNTYAVAKLADGTCWMIENLRLENTANFTTESLSQGFGKSTTYGNFIGLPNPQTTYFSNSSTANSIYYSGTQSGSASINIGTTSNPGYRMPRYDSRNITARSSYPMGTGNVYSYGNYYTWSAAMANTINYANPNGRDANNKTSETVNTSICPAGWRLPFGQNTDNGNTLGGFYYLNYKLNNNSNVTDSVASNNLRAYPNNFIYSGYISGSSVSGKNSSGAYWTSTAYNANYAYSLNLSSSNVQPGTARSIYKYTGSSIRCVLNTKYSIVYEPNGGSGTMYDQLVNSGDTVNLRANTFSAPTGKTFIGWNTAADGSGIMYSDLESVTNLTTVNNTITLYAQWECGTGNICYDQNGANSPTKMGKQTVASNATSVTLWASNFQRSGYGFAGWNTAADGSGTNYGPNEDITDSTTLSAIQSNGLILYAKWVQSAGNLQSWGGCGLMNEGDVTALTDNRDSNTYAVAKLADGNCWMIENLRLADVDSNNNPITLSSANTNNPSLPLNNSDGTTSNSLSSSSDPDSASSPWCGSGIACANQSIMYAGNSDETVGNMTNVNANVYSYGNYYNWYSATAGKGEYGVSFVTDGDLCPTGWHLPYGGPDTGPTGGQSSGGFLYLDVQLGGTGGNQSTKEASLRWRAYPNNFVYSGSITSGSNMSVTGRGSYGVYWSSTGASNTQAGVVMIGDTALRLGYPDYKYSGNMARCVLSN